MTELSRASVAVPGPTEAARRDCEAADEVASKKRTVSSMSLLRSAVSRRRGPKPYINRCIGVKQMYWSDSAFSPLLKARIVGFQKRTSGHSVLL